MTTTTGKQAAAAANEFLVGLHRIGVSRAQAIDSLHTVASEFRKPLITPTPGPAERSALACADALRAAATSLSDHDHGPSRWTPNEVQYDHHATTTPPNPQPLLPPHRHHPPEHRRPPTYHHRRRPTHRHRCRSTHRASTCRNTCGHPCHRNTPTAPDGRT